MSSKRRRSRPLVSTSRDKASIARPRPEPMYLVRSTRGFICLVSFCSEDVPAESFVTDDPVTLRAELVGIDHGIHGKDVLTVCFHRQGADQAIGVTNAEARLAVDRRDLHDAIWCPELLSQPNHQPGNTLGADDRD